MTDLIAYSDSLIAYSDLLIPYSDLLIHVVLSNAALALLLGLVAWLVEYVGKRPGVAHVLWVLVLVKLVTPPMLWTPTISLPTGSTAIIPAKASETPAAATPMAATPRAIERSVDQAVSEEGDAFPLFDEPARATLVEPTPTHIEPASIPQPAIASLWQWSSLWEHLKPALIVAWLLGSIFILTRSLIRIARFDRLLRNESRPANAMLQAMGARLARKLGLHTLPRMLTTTAQISPMVWWTGGRVSVVIPQTLVDQLTRQQLQWVVAHEIAHVYRRDHLVRWLEWLVFACLWWNPIVWWGRHRLRANEEICCDRLVLSALQPQPRVYANALLDAIEVLAAPVIRPPAVASEMNSGGVLRRRLKMIVNTTQRSRSLLIPALAALLALAVLPLGVAWGQDFKAVEKKLGEAVAAGDLTVEQAQVMLEALRDFVDKKDRRRKDDDHDDDQDEKDWDEDEKDWDKGERKGERKQREVQERIEEWVEETAEELKEAVEEGDLTEKEAWKKWTEFLEEELAPKLRAAVKEGYVSKKWAREMARELWKGKDDDQEDRDGDDDRERGDRERDEEETGERLVKAYERFGVNERTLGRIKRALEEEDIEGNQLGGALAAILRIADQMKEDGDDFDMSDRMAKYLEEELDLNDDQIELLEDIASRIAGVEEEDDDEDEDDEDEDEDEDEDDDDDEEEDDDGR